MLFRSNNYADSIDLIISEKDNGIYDAMNKGIDYAHGEWLIFLNAADSLYSQTILEDIFKLKNYTPLSYRIFRCLFASRPEAASNNN